MSFMFSTVDLMLLNHLKQTYGDIIQEFDFFTVLQIDNLTFAGSFIVPLKPLARMFFPLAIKRPNHNPGF